MKAMNHNTRSREFVFVLASALKIATLCLLLGLPNAGWSQDAQQYVFSSGGEYSQSPQMTVSWTLGDSFINTVELDDRIYTQGFQQSFLTIREIKKTEILAFDAKVYPNPTRGILNLKMNSTGEPYNVDIYDVLGKLVHSSTETRDLIEIDLSSYHAGQYFIRLSSEKQARLSVFEIIKL